MKKYNFLILIIACLFLAVAYPIGAWIAELVCEDLTDDPNAITGAGIYYSKNSEPWFLDSSGVPQQLSGGGGAGVTPGANDVMGPTGTSTFWVIGSGIITTAMTSDSSGATITVSSSGSAGGGIGGVSFYGADDGSYVDFGAASGETLFIKGGAGVLTTASGDWTTNGGTIYVLIPASGITDQLIDFNTGTMLPVLAAIDNSGVSDQFAVTDSGGSIYLVDPDSAREALDVPNTAYVDVHDDAVDAINGIVIGDGAGSYVSGDTNAAAPSGTWSFAGSPLVAADIATNAVDSAEINASAVKDSEIDYTAVTLSDFADSATSKTVNSTPSGNSDFFVGSNGENWYGVNPGSVPEAIGLVIGTDVQAYDATIVVDGDFSDAGIMLSDGAGTYTSGDTNAGAPSGTWSFAGSPLVAADIATGAVETAEILDGTIISDDMNFTSTGGVTLSGITAFIIQFNLLNPDDIVSGVSDNIGIFLVDADKYPNGVILDSLWIQQFGVTDYTVDIEEWGNGDNPSRISDIAPAMNIAVGTYKEEIRNAGINDRNLAAGNWIFLDLPTTETDQLFVKIKGRIK